MYFIQITTLYGRFYVVVIQANGAHRAIVSISTPTRQAVGIADLGEGIEPLLAPPGAPVILAAPDAAARFDGWFLGSVIPAAVAAAFLFSAVHGCFFEFCRDEDKQVGGQKKMC